MIHPATVDEYIAAAPPRSQATLLELRRVVLELDPRVAEVIKYEMPTYEHDGKRLLHFAAAKSHVAIYGLIHEDREVPAALKPYLRERSTLRFRIGEPLPTSAIADAIRAKLSALERA